MEPTPFSTVDAIKEGWRVVKREPAVLIALTVLQLAVLSAQTGEPPGTRSGLAQLVAHTAGAALAVGWWRVALRANEGREVSLAALTELSTLELLRYFVTQAIMALVIVTGLVLLIVPGLYIGARWMLAPVVVVDEGRDPVAALRRSWELTEGASGRMVVFAIALVALNLLGLLALGVGVLVTMPTSVLATVHVYRCLTARTTSEPPFAELPRAHATVTP